jgi:hypothetical protein
MKRFSLSVLFLLFSLTVVATIPALAQQDTVMNVHVDKAVAIPGHVLLPGNYVFRMADAQTYPGYVLISSADGSQEFGFVHVFASRRQSYDGPQLVMSHPDQAGLEHIVSWYFPGARYGYRFIYSKRQLRNADLMAQRLQTQSNAGL